MPALLDQLRTEKIELVGRQRTLRIFDEFSRHPTMSDSIKQLDEEIALLQKRIDGIHIRYKQGV